MTRNIDIRTVSSLIVILALAVAAPASHGNGQTQDTGLITNRTLDVAGVQRQYHVFVPANYVDAPIVLLFHGHNSNSSKLIGLTGGAAPFSVWLDIAEEKDILVVVPNGLYVSSSEKGWNDCRADAPTNSSADDVLFISTLIDELAEEYQADTERVYAHGASNGGHFAIRLGLELPAKITALAAITASNAVNSECAASSLPIAVLFMNGTADPLLPYNGGQMAGNRGEVSSTDGTLDNWVTRNGSSSMPDVIAFPDIDTSDNSGVERYTYSGGNDGVETVLYKVINGGHTPPSIAERYRPQAQAILGFQNGDIEMADEVWSFFESKSKTPPGC